MRRSGAISFQLLLESPLEWTLSSSSSPDAPISGHIVECDDMTFIVGYASGSTIFSKGVCRAIYQQVVPTTKDGQLVPQAAMNQSCLQLTQLEYAFESHTEMIDRTAIRSRRDEIGASSLLKDLDVNVRNQQPSASMKNPPNGSQLNGRDEDASSETSSSIGPFRPKRETASEVDMTSVTSSPVKRSRRSEVNNTALNGNEWHEYMLPKPPVGAPGLCDEAMRVLEVSRIGQKLA